MATLVCNNISFISMQNNHIEPLVKIQLKPIESTESVERKEQDKEEFITNILLIKDFNSPEFYDQVISLLKGQLIKHISDDRIWSLQANVWKLCSYNNAKRFMKTIFDAYLNTLKYKEDISFEERKIIDNAIIRWKHANPDENKILNKVLIELSVDTQYLIDNKIIANGIIDAKVSLVEAKEDVEISSSALHMANLNKFFSRHVEFTGNEEDFIMSADFHALYKSWCERNSLECCDVRFFGRLLKIKNVQQKRCSHGAKNICIKYFE